MMQLTIEKTRVSIDGTILERPIRMATLYRLLGREPRVTEPNPSPFEPRPLRYYSWDDIGIYCAENADSREVVEIDVTLNPDLIPENRGTIPSQNPFAGELILFGYRFAKETSRSEFPSFTSHGFRDACNLRMHSGPSTDITICWQRLPERTYVEDGQTKYRDWRDTGRLCAVFFKLTTRKSRPCRREPEDRPKLTLFQKLTRKLTNETLNV